MSIPVAVSPLDTLPLFVNLKDKPCLLVGGGEVAFRKLSLLLRASAAVTVIAPEIHPSIQRELGASVIHLNKRFHPADLDGFFLVIAATDDPLVNRSVFEAAEARNILVNVVDCPDLCRFIFPALIDRSPVIVAVSTGGASPVLARALRAQLEQSLPQRLGQLARFADAKRQEVKHHIKDSALRRRFWERLLSGPLRELVMSSQDEAAESTFRDALAGELSGGRPKGLVSLVGAGPGDPELLTLKALRLLQEADYIVHDRLVSDAILDLSRRDATRIDVGKESSRHTLPQSEINALLAKLALEGHTVVRLKGGDPFLFGRGGEEIETLMQQGLSFQVVPGISAANGCAAYAGIPLTHRDHAHSVLFVTGHFKEGGGSDVNWRELIAPNRTVVIYMGLQAMPAIRQELLKSGVDPELPVALVEEGTLNAQRVVVSTLEGLEEAARSAAIRPPALIIIGTVVQLREKLEWFNSSPSHESGTFPSLQAH